MYFSENDIQKLNESLPKIKTDYEDLVLKYALKNFKTEKSNEFAKHGFARRIKTLQQCVFNVYEICPVQNNNKLSSKELTDLAINLHAFLINAYGCLDNLARIWIEEKNVRNKDGSNLENKQIGFNKRQKIVWRSFPIEFRNYIHEYEEWISYIEDFRHALAHRIPPYIPPYISTPSEIDTEKKLEEKRKLALLQHNFEEYEEISEEIDSLGKFVPWMTHSFSENSKQMVFHAQIISDWNTIIEISNKLFEEL